MDAFLLDWELFWPSYTVQWLLGMALALIGIPVVAREQVLLGAGLVQAGALGVALGVALQFVTNAHGLGAEAVIAAALGIMAGSLLAAHPPQRERPDAIAGWLFLIGSGGSLLLVAGKPAATEALANVQASSLLGASPADAVVAGVVALVTMLAALLAGRKILLCAYDTPMARSLGQHPGWWNFALALWTGLVLAVALRATGAVFTTALLVLPALIARRIVPSLGWMPWTCVALAVVAASGGMAIGHWRELPTAQVSVSLLGLALLAIWSLQALWQTFAGPRRTSPAT